MWRAILAAVVSLVAFDAQAQFTYLDDPALTTGDSADRIIIDASAGTNATQDSIAFAMGTAESAVFTVPITVCTTCSMLLKVQTQDPDGTWVTLYTSTTINSTGTKRFLIGTRQNVITNTDFTGVSITRMPQKFRVEITWTSGTTATYTVQGMVW